MNERSIAVLLVSALVVGSAGRAVPARAQYPIASTPVFNCQDRTARALRTFVAAKRRCVSGCQRRARQGKSPFTDCIPPAFGGTTAQCILDPPRGAEPVAAAAIDRGCESACPLCYAGGDCAAAGAGHVASMEQALDILDGVIFCSTGGNANQNQCRERVLSSLTTFARRHNNCYRQCFGQAQKGLIPAAACAPPNPGDLKTADCLARAVGTAVTAIDHGCFRPRAEAPSCYDGTQAPQTGASWVFLAQLFFDQRVPATFCGSPSGAFLE